MHLSCRSSDEALEFVRNVLQLKVKNWEREMYAVMKLFDTCVGFLPVIRTFPLNLSQGGLQLAGTCQQRIPKLGEILECLPQTNGR